MSSLDETSCAGRDSFVAIQAYIERMKNLIASLLLLASVAPAAAQGVTDPYQQPAQNQAQINQTLNQTQQNNANTQ